VPVKDEEAMDGVLGLFAPAGMEGTDYPWLRNR